MIQAHVEGRLKGQKFKNSRCFPKTDQGHPNMAALFRWQFEESRTSAIGRYHNGSDKKHQGKYQGMWYYQRQTPTIHTSVFQQGSNIGNR